jgi:hypothetical protein
MIEFLIPIVATLFIFAGYVIGFHDGRDHAKSR